MRVVIEWIAQNGKPDMVIMPVSHYNRFDLPIANKFDENASFDGAMYETYGEEVEYVITQKNNKQYNKDTFINNYI